MRKKLCCVLILFLSGNTLLFSQQVSTEQKTIKYQDGQEVFNICKNNPTLNYNDDLEYFWYNSYSGIKSTKGGSGGQLLHGKYQMFNQNGNLVQEVNFFLGLEDGTSRSWDDKGNILETYKYTMGICNYMKFTNDDGYIIEWIGEMLKKGSIKKVFTKYDQLLEISTCIDDLFKLHTKEYYEDYGTPKLKAEYTSVSLL